MRIPDAERIAWLALAVARWDHAAARRSVARAGGPEAFLRLGASGWAAAGCNKDAISRLGRVVRASAGAKETEEAARRGVSILFPGDAGYPARLVHLADPPVSIYLRGATAPLSARAVAIVGTRAASPEARLWSEAAGRASASAGIVVVSGGARGIDAAAHRGALDVGATTTDAGPSAAPTVVVLGGGILRPYPREHVPLFDRIAASGGAVLSEAPLTAPPTPETFPRRNRLIAALAEAVVVVEAPKRSGAINTVTHALDLGREVLVVPWPDGPRCEGSNALLAEGARPAPTPETILATFGVSSPERAGRTLGRWRRPRRVRPRGAEMERRLVEMENEGRAQRLPGGEFLLG